MNINSSVKEISGVGDFYQKKLDRLGIKTVQDFLFHLPVKYRDFSKIAPISRIKKEGFFTVKGEIIEIKIKRIFKRKITIVEATIKDSTSEIIAVWFNQPYLSKALEEKKEYYFSGKVTSKNSKLYFTNPSFELYDLKKEAIHSKSIVSVYPETRGLTSRWMRTIIKSILDFPQIEIPDILPPEIIKELDLLSAREAFNQIHFPKSEKQIEKAKKRISFEQMFLIQLAVLMEKMRMMKEATISIPADIETIKRLTSGLPFELTDAQRKSAWQILKDMEKKYPMNRLLEGDVGSGKTIVAAIGIINAIKSGAQAALMAPTEILAKQHFHGIFKTLNKFNINVGFLTGKEDKFYSKKLKNDTIEISRTKLLKKIKEGEIDLLIGTHALIQKTVKFKNLALVVLDEQHRFGVNQRAELVSRKKGENIKVPHLLSMTATPIPRTLALSFYGDLDISIIDELPQGRKKIITKIVSPSKRKEVYDLTREQLKKGRQVFIICPKIDPSEDENSRWANVKAVNEEFDIIAEKIFPEFIADVIHGKMKAKEREEIMRDFKNKKSDILVSTSVIEVGIDIPNASVMIIEGAERFGLAQLHQFRGRVGRSEHQSYCFLFPESFTPKTKNRLKALLASEDGFALAEQDLKLRGPGDFIGQKQWGLPDIAMSALSNLELVEKAKELAQLILTKDSQLKKYPSLRKEVDILREKIHLE